MYKTSLRFCSYLCRNNIRFLFKITTCLVFVLTYFYLKKYVYFVDKHFGYSVHFRLQVSSL